VWSGRTVKVWKGVISAEGAGDTMGVNMPACVVKALSIGNFYTSKTSE